MLKRIAISDHAASRYSVRVDPLLSPEQARAFLENHASEASILKQRTVLGDEQWLLKRSHPCVLVLKRDKGTGSIPVVVTVFPAFPSEIEDEEQQRAAQEVVSSRLHGARHGRPRRRRCF